MERSFRVKSLLKAIDILELLARSSSPLNVSEISEAVGMPRSTVFNLVHTLLERRFVERAPEGRGFVLGLKLFELGNMVRSGMRLRDVAVPHMESLVRSTGERVYLALVDGHELLYIECAEADGVVFTRPVVGRRAPLYCTGGGKAALAFFSEEELRRWFEGRTLRAFTENTITDSRVLAEELALIRSRGYAVDNSEHEWGIRCVGAPIFDSDGVVAAISLTGPSPRFPEERIPKLAHLITNAAAAISTSLGFSAPEAARSLRPMSPPE